MPAFAACLFWLLVAPALASAQEAATAGAAERVATSLPSRAGEREVLPGSGAVRMLLRDGRFLEGRLLGLEGEDLLLAASIEGGAPTRVPLADLVALAQGKTGTVTATPDSSAAAPAPDVLDLSSVAVRSGPGGIASDAPPQGLRGDRLMGRLLGGDADGVRFELSGALPFGVPFEAITRLLPHATGPLDRLALLPGAEADDRLWRLGKDGTPDSLTGVVESVNDGKVVFASALGTLPFSLGDVLAIVFAPEARPTGPLPGVHVVVRLRDGSRIDAGLLEWHDGRCVLATRFAARLELPTVAVASLVRSDGPFVLLADLPPSRVEQWPTFGAPADFLFPWRKDLSVTGQLLSVGSVSRATGLGVHSNSRLAFTVPAGASTLFVTAGLCDEVNELPARGSVNFELRVDGALLAATGLVREGEAARTLRLDGLHGGETLELVTLDGGDDDAGDRAAWVDGVFLLGGG